MKKSQQHFFCTVFALLVGIQCLWALDVQGVVLYENGKLAANAFVYDTKQPRLCALTDTQGVFRLRIPEGVSSLVLRASGPASKTAEQTVVVGINSTITLLFQDAELTKIEIGCALATSYQQPGAQSKKEVSHYGDEHKQCIAVYEAFMNSTGTIIQEKLENGQDLDDAEKPYRYVVIAALGADKKKKKTEFMTRIGERYLVSMKKAFKGGLITEEDIANMRDNAALSFWWGMREKHHAPPEAPHYFEPFIQKPGYGDHIYDIEALSLEAIMESPYFSPYSSLTAAEFIRPEGLGMYLMRYDYWQKSAENPEMMQVRENMPPLLGFKKEDYFNCGDYIGKKPMLIMINELEDRTGCEAMSHYFNHLYRVYSEHVEIVRIMRVSANYGDMRFDEVLCFGNPPDENPLQGFSYRRGELDYVPWRLARTAVIGFMFMPDRMLPTYVDDVGARASNAFSNGLHKGGQGAWFSLIDKNGRRILKNSSAPYQNPERTAPAQSLNGFFNPFYSEVPIEAAIRGLLRNGGDMDVSLKDVSFPAQPKRIFLSDGGTYGVDCIITSVDVEAGLVGIKMVPVKNRLRNKPHKHVKEVNFTVQVGPSTRLEKSIAERHRETPCDGFEHVSLAAFTVGDKVFVDFPYPEELKTEVALPTMADYMAAKSVLDKESHAITREKGKSMDAAAYRWGPNCGPKHITQQYQKLDIAQLDGRTMPAYRITDFNGRRANKHMVFWGTITEKKSDSTTSNIIVEMNEKDAQTHGYRLWKKYEDIANPTFDERYDGLVPELKRKAVQRWAEGGVAARRYEFIIDNSVSIIRNAEAERSYEDLKIGDTVMVTYYPYYESQYQNSKPIYAERVVASTATGL